MNASLSTTTSRCPGCGLELPAGTRVAYDGYYHCSSECWSVYTEVLGAEFQDPALFARVHMTTVDSYAVQHAGGPHPDKSIDVHLVGLHLVLERGIAPVDVPARFRRLVAAVRRWPHYEPPEDTGPLTVSDVAEIAGMPAHAERVLAWGRQLWCAWEAHHDAIRRLAAGEATALEGQG